MAQCAGFLLLMSSDDLLFEASEVARFLLEVEGTTLDIDEEIDIEDRITKVMRSVGEKAKTILRTRAEEEDSHEQLPVPVQQKSTIVNNAPDSFPLPRNKTVKDKKSENLIPAPGPDTLEPPQKPAENIFLVDTKIALEGSIPENKNSDDIPSARKHKFNADTTDKIRPDLKGK